MKKNALIFAFIFSAVIGMAQKKATAFLKTNFDEEKEIAKDYTKSAQYQFNTGNYHTAYELLLKALQLSKITGDTAQMSNIYSNIGNIHYHFRNYDLAHFYYSNALKLCQDSVIIAVILNNLGYVEVQNGHLDDAFDYLSRSSQMIRQLQIPFLQVISHSLGAFYEEKKMYDSAFHYYQLSMIEAEKTNDMKQKAEALSDLGKLFFETKKPHLAEYYTELSNTIADGNTYLAISMENYLTLSRIAETKGDKAGALEYLKQYSNIKDSISELEKAAEINQLQRLHETLDLDRQIEQLTVEQQIKEKVVRYQKIIQWILLTVLIVISIVLIIVFSQNKKLNRAYKILVEKNLEIIEIQENSPETNAKKYQKSVLSDDMQNELLKRIRTLMNDMSVVCDPDLSIEKLADLVQSNRAYVSQVINDVLKKNFRTFLNDYRIREAQRLFLELDLSKYTIESIAVKVGFKSRSTFISAFKEVTGVNPSFYLAESLHKR